MFRKVSGPEEGRVVAFDPDRPAVEAARRDPSRFETLYRRYVAQVYNFAVYELADHHAAEDLTEQVFLQAMAALPRFRDDPHDGRRSFRAWLFRIARNLASNERRRSRRHPVAPLDAAAAVQSPDDPAAAAVRTDDARRAWAAVDRLPADRRAAIVLRFVHEMSIGEIAGALDRSEGAVRVLLHRALRSVAEELDAPRRTGGGPIRGLRSEPDADPDAGAPA